MKRTVLLLAVILLPACGADDDAADLGGASLAPVVVRAGEQTAAAVASGGQLVVLLAGNPSTGYTWELSSGIPECVRAVGEPQFLPSSGLVGAPGDVVLAFDAVAAGTEDLVFAYQRPWEDEPPLETVTLTVTVR